MPLRVVSQKSLSQSSPESSLQVVPPSRRSEASELLRVVILSESCLCAISLSESSPKSSPPVIFPSRLCKPSSESSLRVVILQVVAPNRLSESSLRVVSQADAKARDRRRDGEEMTRGEGV